MADTGKEARLIDSLILVLMKLNLTQQNQTPPPHHNRFTALFPGPPG